MFFDLKMYAFFFDKYVIIISMDSKIIIDYLAIFASIF